MGATNQLLPTISALVALGEFAQEHTLPATHTSETVATTVAEGLSPMAKQQRAEREWQGALGALTHLLTQSYATYTNAGKSGKSRRKRRKEPQALILSGPVPILNDPEHLTQLANWTFVPSTAEEYATAFSALSPVERLFQQKFKKQTPATRLLPMWEDDPLEQEQFALVLTPEFSLVLVLGEDADGDLRFQFSFMPEVANSVWRILRSRIHIIRPQQLEFIDPLVEQFEPKDPNYRIVSQFNRWMLACLPQPSRPSVTKAHSGVPLDTGSKNEPLSDSELLKAMAHEIRTPLTTIRTYTRSLLKRQNLDEKVIKRLQSIDRECTQQIDRFNLIFRAVELEAASQSPKSPLSAIELHQIFREAIPKWKQAAQRRNISIDVGLPNELPMVASDPVMLQEVLTGLVELFTHSVSAGSHIQLHVLLAGEKLKLQFQSDGASSLQPSAHCHSGALGEPPTLQALGHLLMFQPETGGLSLNLEATKSLFNALGAKLTVRERSNQGTTWTVFLPLEASGLKSYPVV